VTAAIIVLATTVLLLAALLVLGAVALAGAHDQLRRRDDEWLWPERSEQ
jgi:hypothetical protein